MAAPEEALPEVGSVSTSLVGPAVTVTGRVPGGRAGVVVAAAVIVQVPGSHCRRSRR